MRDAIWRMSFSESAAKQIDIAAKQKSIGNQQHIQADKLAEQAVKSDDLGRRLQANAVEIEGDTHVVPRGQSPRRPPTR